VKGGASTPPLPVIGVPYILCKSKSQALKTRSHHGDDGIARSDASGLNTKVDTMAANQVTGHEFEQLSNKIDKYTLQAFEQYKQFTATQIGAANMRIDMMATRAEHQRLGKEMDESFKSLTDQLHGWGKLPNWVQSLILLAGGAGGIGGVGLWLYELAIHH
jgi:hypothetical protein